MKKYHPHPGASGDLPHVTCWTDGSNYGEFGGWAAILRFGQHEREITGSVRDESVTNNRMEMTAALEALWACKHPVRMTIHSDSAYMVNGWTMYLPNWVSRGWKTAGDKPKDVANQDLWRGFLVASRCHQIEMRHVKGHAGDDLNERCDALANVARKAAELLPAADIQVDQEARARQIAYRLLGVQ